MENIQNPQPTETVQMNPSPVQVQNKPNIVIPILFTLVISAVIFGAGGYYFGMRTTVSQKSMEQDQRVVMDATKTELTQSSPTPVTTSSPMVNVKKYTSKFEKLSFEYPANWVLSSEQPRSNFPEGDALGIQDPSGKVEVTWISAMDGFGGSCDPNIPFTQKEGEMGAPCPLYEVVDKQKLDHANLYYVAYIITRDGVTYEPYFALQAPEGLLTTQRAMAYLFFMGKNNGKVSTDLSGKGFTSGTKEDAQNFFMTEEAKQAKNILLSASY